MDHSYSLEKEKENFALKYQIYKLRKEKQSESRTPGTIEKRSVKIGRKKDVVKETRVKEEHNGTKDNDINTEDLSKEILRLNMEKDSLLRRVSDLETDLVEHKEAANKKTHHDEKVEEQEQSKSILSTIYIEEARKKERNAFKTLAAHDAALLKKFEAKVASLYKQKESMKSIIDELTNKLVISFENLEEKEKLLRERESDVELLKNELEKQKSENVDLVECLRVAKDSVGTDLKVEEAISCRDMDYESRGNVVKVDGMDEETPWVGSDSETIRTVDSIPSARSQGGEERGRRGAVNSTMLLSTPGTIRDSENDKDQGAVTTGDSDGLNTVHTEDREKDLDRAALAPHIASDLSCISKEGLQSSINDLDSHHNGTRAYSEDTAGLHESIREILAARENEIIEELRATLREKEGLMREQERSFEEVISRARDTTLLEAEEIARLERALEESQIEVRSLSRATRAQEKELKKLKDEKKILEDVLLENEASAVNKAMEALNAHSPLGIRPIPARKASTLAASPASQGPQGSTPTVIVATTPGELSTQDMVDHLHMQEQNVQTEAASRQMPQALRLESAESSRNGEGGNLTPFIHGNVYNRTPGMASPEEGVESLIALEKAKQKDVIMWHRQREEQLMNALEGVLLKYSSLERKLNLEKDNRKRSVGMKF